MHPHHVYVPILAALCAWAGPLQSEEAAKTPIRAPKNGGVYVVAHRGAHDGIPENTLAAYRKAIELGADFVEIDVRTTQDGKFVCIHNSTIDGYVKGASGKVRDMTLEQLRGLDIGSRIDPEWSREGIPTFEEVLDLCKGRIGIYLDLKDASPAALVEAIRARGMERDVLWYASRRAIREVRALCPGALIMLDPGPKDDLPALIGKLGLEVIAPVWRSHSKAIVDQSHAAGAIVIVDEDFGQTALDLATEREPECWKTGLAWKTDGFQTDHPEALIQYLKKRAQQDPAGEQPR